MIFFLYEYYHIIIYLYFFIFITIDYVLIPHITHKNVHPCKINSGLIKKIFFVKSHHSAYMAHVTHVDTYNIRI